MPAKPPPKPGRPAKPPPNACPIAAGAAAAPADPAAAAAAFICMKGRKTSGFIRGPTEPPTNVFVSPSTSHPGIAPYSAIRLSARLPTENPFEFKTPKGVAMVEDVELPLAPNTEVKGDARLCSVPLSWDISCDSADCTPVPIEEAAD